MDAAAAVLAADSLAETFGQMSRQLRELVPHDDLAVYELSQDRQSLRPVFASGRWVEETMSSEIPVGQGITGRALRSGDMANVPRTDLDPSAETIPGTVDEPEAMVCVPLNVEGEPIGALNTYRAGSDVAFSAQEAEVIERFATIAALAFNSARQRELLERQASTDGLTDLLNRRAYLERLEAEIARAERSGSGVGVVLLDLDDFKRINDRYGHFEGDRVLCEIAARLRDAVRIDETVARYGGEEFALILASATADEALAATERFRSAIAAVMLEERPLSASAGLALWPPDGSNADELLRAADTALYEAKGAGKDRTARFTG